MDKIMILEEIEKRVEESLKVDKKEQLRWFYEMFSIGKKNLEKLLKQKYLFQGEKIKIPKIK